MITTLLNKYRFTDSSLHFDEGRAERVGHRHNCVITSLKGH